MLRQGHPLGHRNLAFSVTTRRLCGEQKAVVTQLLVSQHGHSNSMSRHTFWCRDQAWDRQGGLVSRPGFSVATGSPLSGVATRPLVSRQAKWVRRVATMHAPSMYCSTRNARRQGARSRTTLVCAHRTHTAHAVCVQLERIVRSTHFRQCAVLGTGQDHYLGHGSQVTISKKKFTPGIWGITNGLLLFVFFFFTNSKHMVVPYHLYFLFFIIILKTIQYDTTK